MGIYILNLKKAKMQEKKSIDLNNLFKKFDTMKHNFEGKKWKSVAKYFNELMVRIAEISFISEIDATYNSDVDLHVLARNTLEIGVEWCAVTGDVNGFERYQAMLWSYYFDFAVDLPESDKKYEIVGLNLMQLLSKNEAVIGRLELGGDKCEGTALHHWNEVLASPRRQIAE